MPTSRLRAAAAATACTALLLCSAATLPATAEDTTSFKRVSTTPAYLNAGGEAAKAVAEISTVSPDGNTLFYTDAGGKAVGKFDITDPSNPKPLGKLDVGGEPTSVYAIDGYVLVVVDSSQSYKNPTGHVSVLNADTFEEVRRIELGGQPDSIDIRDDLAVIAIENERDEDAKNDRGDGKKGDLPQAPAGELAFIHLEGAPSQWTKTATSLVDLPGLTEASDPEPEYVKFSPDGSKIAVTLQENNAVVIVDAATEKVLSSWSTGEATVEGIDTEKDGQINLNGSITAPREPDSIGWVDDAHVATANEGDWKGGSRGWTIFEAESGNITWDAGNSFEYQAIRNGHWLDKRAGKKGTEPEGLAIETYDGVRYAFVGSERANFVAVYDVTDPANPAYLQMLPTTNGPEGILPIPGRNLLAVSSEEDEPGTPMRATVALYELSPGEALYPQITSDDVDGKPIPWLALGALAASDEAGQLYTIPDDALLPNRILTVDATSAPARITSAIDVTLDGKPTEFDVEGLYAVPCKQGFWLGVEGNGKDGEEGTANQLVQTSQDGKVLRTVPLPQEVTEHLGKWGIEGVTGNPEGTKLYVALQRDKDKSKPTRILEYDIASGEFRTFMYELENTDVKGDWLGLSEITFVSSDEQGVRLGLIERDKGTGPDAKIKHITEVTIAPDAKDGDTLSKKLVYDVLPDLQATHGWTQEKLEGLTIDADGNAFVVTDNDGLDDINGETVFLNLGTIFGDVTRPNQCSPSDDGGTDAGGTDDGVPNGQESTESGSKPDPVKPRPGLPRTGC